MTPTADLFRQLILVIEDFRESRDTYHGTHPTFSKEKDARLTIFGRCISAMDVALLYLMFRTFHIPYVNWWNSLQDQFNKNAIKMIFNWNPDELDRARIIKTLDNHWAFSNIVLLFAILESSVRWISKAVYSTDPNAGRGDLTTIYKTLLFNKYSEYEKLIELFRLCRNTSHNNGVYFPRWPGDDKHVYFKGVTYDFIDCKSVELGDVHKLLFFDIAPELLKMINDIVNSEVVKKSDEIIDLSAK